MCDRAKVQDTWLLLLIVSEVAWYDVMGSAGAGAGINATRPRDTTNQCIINSDDDNCRVQCTLITQVILQCTIMRRLWIMIDR